MFNHLRLERWPFFMVPEPALCTFIADRALFRDDIEQLLRNLARQNNSSIHPMWSWFGAGKTHTLYYLSHRAAQIRTQGNGHLQTIYTEFPRNPRSFVDVYKSFTLPLDPDLLSEVYLEIHTSPDAHRLERTLHSISPDLVSALRVVALGQAADREIALRWVRAESLTAADCRKLGVSRRITSSEDSSRVLIALIHAFGLFPDSENRVSSRMIWLIDELQRIEHLPPRIRREINTGIHSTFNACPTGLSIILSFSGRPTRTLPPWFSPELKDRIGRTKVLILPPMQTSDAMTFVQDVLAHFRTDGAVIDPYFPFTNETCRMIIEDIKDRDELKPRAIMQAFHAVLLEADQEIEAGRAQVVTPSLVRRVLDELVQLG